MPAIDDPPARDPSSTAPPQRAVNLMGDWWEGVREQGKLIAWVVIGASTTPIVLGLAGINPPWPRSVTVMTAFGQLLAMVWAYQTMRGKKDDAAIEAAMRLYLRLLIVFVAIYFLIHSFFVFIVPTDHQLATKGFVCSPDAMRLDDVARYCPFVPLDKIKDFGYETDMIWAGWSISVVQFLILAFWIASFYALAFFLAAFVVNRQNLAVGKSSSSL
jgi:hypothetical protein